MLERRTHANGVVTYASPLLEQIGVGHGFSTRIGGVSEKPFDSINLGNPTGCDRQDSQESIQQNYVLLQSALGIPNRERCWVHQVHGAEVEVVRRGTFASGRKADALVCDDPERVIAIRVADCVPILLASVDGRVVAAAHAGWRGIVAEIVPATIAAMRAFCAAEPLIAAVGPCISAAKFEVGPEVIQTFRDHFGEEVISQVDSRSGKGHVDLRAALHMQLLENGVAESKIDHSDRCTVRDSAEFFSHRRDNGVTGRMAALIAPVIR